MRIRTPEKSPILLLGRNTVIIGAVVIVILSFGLGYFFGFKGGDLTGSEKEPEEAAVKTAKLPSDEKNVIETSPAAPVIPAPVIPEAPSAPKAPEPPAVKNEEAQKQDRQADERSKDAQGKQEREKAAAAKDEKNNNVENKPSPKTVKQKTPGKQSKSDVSGVYAVQFGAFPSKDGAEALSASLKKHGIKPYVVKPDEHTPYYRVRSGSYKTKKEAETASIALEKKTGINNFVTKK
jgi:cell division septation protein DedD